MVIRDLDIPNIWIYIYMGIMNDNGQTNGYDSWSSIPCHVKPNIIGISFPMKLIILLVYNPNNFTMARMVLLRLHIQLVAWRGSLARMSSLISCKGQD
jgi:hypothetical protein